MIAPISFEKRDKRERSFPKEKGSQWTHSTPSRTERVCSSPNAKVVCVIWFQKRWHGSVHLLKRFIILTLQKQSPLKTKRGWRVPQAPFYSRRRSFAYIIGFHLPMSSALCVFIHASETGHAEGVPIAPSRGRSVEFPSEGNIKTVMSKWINIIYSCNVKAELSASLLQSSVSHDPSEIILIYWFAAQ